MAEQETRSSSDGAIQSRGEVESWRETSSRRTDMDAGSDEWMTDRRLGSEKVGWRGRWEREQQ